MDRTPSWPARTLAAVAIAGAVMMLTASPARAHEGIASSTPRAGSTIDSPITEVTVEFLGEVSDDPRLAILDPDENPLPSEMTKLSPTTYRLDFAPLTRHGTYIVQYVAQVASDGHLTIGAFSFNYGSSGSGLGLATWIVLGIVSTVILGVGIWFSVRQRQRLAADATA